MKNGYELTLRVILLSIILTIILAMSNAYLALKIGMLTSASIPAAVLSMGILRCFKNSSLLENNLVQTAASAGEAIAGGIVYTIPALIIIHYWFGFSYWQNFWIALLGGILGVLFSIPLRAFLVTDKSLPFPEGAAIAEVLKTSTEKSHFYLLLKGGGVGGLIELCQTGFKVIASQWQAWWVNGHTVMGLGVGFSPTLIGAGYLIGFNLGVSIIIGACLGWVMGIPVLSQFFPDFVSQADRVSEASEIAGVLWSDKMRYVAIGTMLTAGIISLCSLIRPLTIRMRQYFKDFVHNAIPETVCSEDIAGDIPWRWNMLGIFLTAIALVVLLWQLFPLEAFHLNSWQSMAIIGLALIYVLVIGFIFSGITGYFSGLVGVSASPGSAVMIAGIILIGVMLASLLHIFCREPLTLQQTTAAEAIAIIIGAIITGIACIANDNIQDLKVGHILNASPWKQEVMLLLGVVVAALVIPPVMQILFEVYGIGNVFPHPGMDPTQALPAPPAAMMAALAQAVFSHHLPWAYLMAGFVIALVIMLVLKIVRRYFNGATQLSVLGIGIGMYLPLSSSVPLFVGSCLAKKYGSTDNARSPQTLLACGLVAGSALMDVVLAIPFAITSSPDILKIDFLGTGLWSEIIRTLFGVGIWVLCVVWFKQLTLKVNK